MLPVAVHLSSAQGPRRIVSAVLFLRGDETPGLARPTRFCLESHARLCPYQKLVVIETIAFCRPDIPPSLAPTFPGKGERIYGTAKNVCRPILTETHGLVQRGMSRSRGRDSSEE